MGEVSYNRTLKRLANRIQCDYVAPHMVEFEEELAKRYKGLPTLLTTDRQLWRDMPQIWYPG